MEEPLFGESNQSVKYCQYGTCIVILAAVLEALIVAVLKGFSLNFFPHFSMAAVILTNLVILIILVKWYQNGDLDPKFKFLIIWVIICIFAVVFTTNFYGFKVEFPPPPSKNCNDGGGFWNNGRCLRFTGLNPQLCLNGTSGWCVKLSQFGQDLSGNCVRCNVTTASTYSKRRTERKEDVNIKKKKFR